MKKLYISLLTAALAACNTEVALYDLQEVMPRYTLTVGNPSTQPAAGCGTAAILSGEATGNLHGSTVEVGATPAEGAAFVKWVASDDAAAPALSTDNPWRFQIEANTTLYAVFRITVASGSAQEDVTLTAGGTIDGGGVAFTAETQLGTYGSLAIEASGAWIYTLDNESAVVQALVDDDSKTETFTVALDDGSTSTVTITVKGKDDPAIITGNDTGMVKEDETTTATGKLDVTDPDAGQAVFTAGTIQNGVYGSLTIDVAGNWTYALNNADSAVQVLKESESVIRPITVTSADGTTHVITVTIAGTNETATTGSGTVKEDEILSVNGTLVATGVATFLSATQNGTYGSLTIDAAGNWTYTLNNTGPAVQALVLFQTETEIFTVTFDNGGTTTVTITVQGLDDGAIIVPHSPGAERRDSQERRDIRRGWQARRDRPRGGSVN